MLPPAEWPLTNAININQPINWYIDMKSFETAMRACVHAFDGAATVN